MKIKDWVYRFLRKAQKYTGTDNVYLVSGGFWLTLGQVVSTLAYMLLAMAFANLLDPVTYGNYKYVLSLFGMLGIFSLMGMKSAIIQAVARGLEGSFYTGFKTRLKWGSAGSLIAIGVAIYYWFQGNEILPIPLLISAVFLPLFYASKACRGFLAGRKLFNIGVKYDIFNQIIFVGAIVATLYLTKSLFWLIAVYFVSQTFLDYFFYLFVKVKFRPNKKEDPQTLNYGKHLSLAGIISLIGDYLDKILLFNLVGSSQLAVYSFANIIPDQIGSFAGIIPVLALPKLAPKSREEIKANVMKKFWKLAFLAGIIMILYIIITPPFYKIFFSQYLQSIPYAQVLALSFISLPASLLDTVFEAKMMKKSIYLLKTFPLVKIILYVVLIPLYGIWGLISARVGMTILNLAFTLFLFRKI